MATASTAVSVKVAQADEPTLLVPFAPGKNVSLCDGNQPLVWQQHDVAVLMPAWAQSGLDGGAAWKPPNFALDQGRTLEQVLDQRIQIQQAAGMWMALPCLGLLHK